MTGCGKEKLSQELYPLHARSHRWSGTLSKQMNHARQLCLEHNLLEATAALPTALVLESFFETCNCLLEHFSLQDP